MKPFRETALLLSLLRVLTEPLEILAIWQQRAIVVLNLEHRGACTANLPS